MLFIQLLNYEEFFLKGTDSKYQRNRRNDVCAFYDFGNRTINFNILKIQKTSQQLMHTLESIELNPMRFEDINEQLYICGFSDIQKYGSLTFEKFSKKFERFSSYIKKTSHEKYSFLIQPSVNILYTLSTLNRIIQQIVKNESQIIF